ncbi:MAG TPA: hypothetical protein VE934_10040 [Polaromonas sp.]|uniref:hypothetical protein n=1 Tax=Polaromonas sp. TaxID=1869339 RepID=UPI002D36EA13|nr:hypothetical protein [Polaromonas sp.]HYW57292.1 hypothetical protein [Polaromonas sp.]
MQKTKRKPLSFVAATMLAAATSCSVGALAANGESGNAALQARYTALAPQLARNEFQRPLVIESTESSNAVSGNAYAVINYPFATVSDAFKNPANWCDVLMLHLNTKFCRAADEVGPSKLEVSVGKKTPQEIKDAYSLTFDFRPAAATPDYMSVRLNADKGPLGTNNYRINLQATPIAGGKTFMHLQYSYGYGMAGRIAMQGYLSTIGSGKLGFTRTENAGEKKYVDGMRGAVERNTMRYYLAIDAYLASMTTSPAEQLDRRLQHWFDATEQYPRQLREVDRAAYLTMKRAEHQRAAK